MKKKTLLDLEESLIEAVMLGLILDVQFLPNSVLVKLRKTENVDQTIKSLIQHVQQHFETSFRYFYSKIGDDDATLEIFHFQKSTKNKIDHL